MTSLTKSTVLGSAWSHAVRRQPWLAQHTFRMTLLNHVCFSFPTYRSFAQLLATNKPPEERPQPQPAQQPQQQLQQPQPQPQPQQMPPPPPLQIISAQANVSDDALLRKLEALEDTVRPRASMPTHCHDWSREELAMQWCHLACCLTSTQCPAGVHVK